MILLPVPKKQEQKEGYFKIKLSTMIVMAPSCAPGTEVYAKLLKDEIAEYAGLEVSVTRGRAKEGDIVLEPDPALGEQQYTLAVEKDSILIRGGSLSSLGWGVQTLRQVIRQCAGLLPLIRIEDEPDLPNRGFFHDVTRGRVQTLPNLKKLVDTMAFYKLNQLQLNMEHTYLFRDLSELWRDETPLTAEEIMELDQYCFERGIELVPCLASFGHLYKLLSTRTYAEYCELTDSDSQEFSFFDRMAHHTVDVSNPGSMELILGMIEEYMQLFRSNQFNICADETFDLGTGKSKALAQEKGRDRLYIDFISGLFEFLIKNGKKPMFWGDIICGFPKLLKELPENVVCLTWGYLPNQRDAEVRTMHDAGAVQYVCPGVCGWNTWVNFMSGSYSNIRKMCSYARKYHAIGVLNTDWGDFGHINQPIFSIPGLIYGAAFSWNGTEIAFDELNRQISILEFGDHSGRLVGCLAQMNELNSFCWRDTVMIKEWTQKGKSREEIAKDFERKNIREKAHYNGELDALEEEFLTVSRSLDAGHKAIVSAASVSFLAIRVWNQVGQYILSVKDGNPDPEKGKELACELERCLYYYKKNWRENSKEGDLGKIEDVFCWYADRLRDGFSI